jgi:hypothetical protein
MLSSRMSWSILRLAIMSKIIFFGVYYCLYILPMGLLMLSYRVAAQLLEAMGDAKLAPQN